MTETRIGFIGGGNMARSLIGGLLASGHAAHDLLVSDPSPSARQQLATLGPLTLTEHNDRVAEQADVLVLAVKPQAMAAVLEPLAPLLSRRRPLLISIAAGLSTAALARWAGPLPLVRCMPNTPALIGSGMSVLYATDAVDETGRELASQILAAAGAVSWIDREADMDAVTAVSGSGPAYFFHLMELMISAGVEQGLAPEQARALVLQTALGAARMAAEQDEDPAVLRQQVTSPGGTTAAALEVFSQGDLAALVNRAVTAAADRSRALAAELSGEDRT